MDSQRFRLICLILGLSALALLPHPSSAQKRVLSLQQCIDEGIQNNLGYQIEKLNYETNLVNIRQAQASRLPSLNVNGNQSYSFGRSIDPFTNQFINQTIRSNNFSANLNFPIFAGFQVLNSVKRSKSLAQVKQLQNEKLKNDLTLNIINAYLSVVTNRIMLKNADVRLGQSREQLNQLEQQYKAGKVPYADIDRFNAQLLTDQVTMATTNQNLQNSLLSLKYLVLKDVNEEIDVDVPKDLTPDSTILNLSVIQVEDEALGRLPEIKAAQEQIQAQTFAERVARGALYPTLNFSAQQYTGYSSSRKKVVYNSTIVNPRTIDLLTAQGDTLSIPSSLFENSQNSATTQDYPFADQLRDNTSRAVAFQVNIPILNGLRNRSTLDVAKVNTKIARLNLDNQRRTTSQQIRSAYLTAKTNKARFDLSKRQVDAQRAVYKNALARFEAGRSTSFETTTERNNLILAESQFTQTILDYLYSIKLLEFYTGRLTN